MEGGRGGIDGNELLFGEISAERRRSWTRSQSLSAFEAPRGR